MFSREDLACLDPGYFEIIYMDDRDVTIMSRNTRHMWYIHNPEYPLMRQAGIQEDRSDCIG